MTDKPAFVRTTEILETTKVKTAEGNIYFRIMAEYRNGQYYGRYFVKNDGREYTDIGRQYVEYMSEAGYRAAIKRAQKLQS